jgi:hypothetical protein
MVANSERRKSEASTDLLVRELPQEQRQNFALARRQLRDWEGSPVQRIRTDGRTCFRMQNFEFGPFGQHSFDRRGNLDMACFDKNMKCAMRPIALLTGRRIAVPRRLTRPDRRRVGWHPVTPNRAATAIWPDFSHMNQVMGIEREALCPFLRAAIEKGRAARQVCEWLDLKGE